jgi:DNA-binding NarL/FixJ family response regulator
MSAAGNSKGPGSTAISSRKEAYMGRAVGFLDDDLFFQMKIAETAKHLGVEFKAANTAEALLGLLDPPTKVVLIDLNAKNQPLAALQQLLATQKDMRVVAFLSHVQTELAAQARAAGCTEVMPRSAFTQNLAAILQTAKD